MNPETYAICKADMLLKGDGEQADHISYGSTLSLDGNATRQFDFMLSNPPYGKSWKVDAEKMGGKKEILDTRFNAYLEGGEQMAMIPRTSDGQLLFLLNNVAKMKMKAWQGSYGVSRFDGIVSPAYFVFDIQYDINIDFFNRAIRSIVYVNYFGQASDGIRVGQWDLSMQRMKEIPFLLPPRPEQDQIVRFLDWKVSSINKLISIKKRQIVLLKEQENQSISHIVLHGLHGSLLKDSGNRWVGNIPIDWDTIKLGRFCSFQNGISESGEFFTSGTPFVGYGDVYRHLELPETVSGVAQSNEQQQEVFSVREGDIFFTRTSENIEEIWHPLSGW